MIQPLISLLHPSRGRPFKSFENSKEWIEKAGCPVELIVSLDNSDPTKDDYLAAYFHQEGYDRHIIYNDNKSVVEATNIAARQAKGNILLYLSDDFKCPDNWGVEILREFHGENRPLLLKVDDCLQPFHVAVLTIPIMNRALYEKLGYFFHPDFKSMFCDEHLYWICHRLGALKNAPHLKFPHEHCSIGKADNDETYKRSAANWDQGKEAFAKHKAAGFPL